jgi:hypothetical protein
MRENKEKVINEFKRIRDLGYVKNTRLGNRDGGIGNTFEDLLGVTENNLRDPDFLGFEVKTKRHLNTSYITLFSKSPSHPSGANSILRERYGEVRDVNHPNHKKLYSSVFGNRNSLVYGKYNMKLNLDKDKEKLILEVTDLDTKEFDDSVYWTFNDIKISSSKMKSLIVVSAVEKEIDNERHCHFNNSSIYFDFNFDKFLKCIETGKIMFDIRIGVHNSGKNIGRTHDHGSGFRVKKENVSELFDEVVLV